MHLTLSLANTYRSHAPKRLRSSLSAVMLQLGQVPGARVDVETGRAPWAAPASSHLPASLRWPPLQAHSTPPHFPSRNCWRCSSPGSLCDLTGCCCPSQTSLNVASSAGPSLWFPNLAFNLFNFLLLITAICDWFICLLIIVCLPYWWMSSIEDC